MADRLAGLVAAAENHRCARQQAQLGGGLGQQPTGYFCRFPNGRQEAGVDVDAPPEVPDQEIAAEAAFSIPVAELGPLANPMRVASTRS